MKYVLGLLALVLALVAIEPINAATYEWQSWTTTKEKFDGTTVEHQWKTSMVQGAVNVLYRERCGKLEHAITVSEYNGRPLIRWTAPFNNHRPRPPWPSRKILRYYYGK